MQEYIHYGCTEFNKNKFKKVTNIKYSVKPFGGLWASPVDTEYGWKEWCEIEGFRECTNENSFKFTLSENSKVYHIYSVEDLYKLSRESNYILDSSYCIDFEKMILDGYDALELHLSSDKKMTNANPDYLFWQLYGWIAILLSYLTQI